MLTGSIAPEGQTSEHFVHSGLHQPFSYDISGCISVMRFPEGLKTWLGHTVTHSWHAVQCCEKGSIPEEPAGFSGVFRSGILLSSIAASPPSTFISWALTVAAVRAAVVEAMNARLELSEGVSLVSADVFPFVPAFFHTGLYFIAPSLHVPIQSKQSTHLL